MLQFLDAQIGWLLTCWFVGLTSPVDSFPSGDLCTMLNEYTYYIKVGEVGRISVGNESFPSGQNGTSTVPPTCMVELVTCPSCHISVSFLHINISTCSQDDSCRCSYVQIVEPSYDHLRRHLCGFGRNSRWHRVESQTKVISIRYTRKSAYDSFTLQFVVRNNIYTFRGSPDSSESNGTGTFQSPHFPQIYPSDYVAEYRFHNLNALGCVQVTFTDFRISPWSHIEVLDTNRSRMAMYDGNIFRPPVIASTGPNLTVYFKANDDYPKSGFRAKYAFFADADQCQATLPSTECGGSLENHGGVITLSKTNTDKKMQIYDCVWIIHPKFTYTYETYLALRIAQFKNMGQKSSLEIRQGITSTARLLYTVRGYHQKPSGQELIVSASSGYYLRFSGCFGNNSFMSIVYSTFTYNECHHTQEYRCKNGRCIKKQLRCDGFNHCGDKSDENSCFTGTSSGRDTSWWQSFSPKLYYPKQDGGGSGNPTTLILIASIAGFGMFVWTFATVLTKLQKKRRTPNIRQAVHTISGEIDAENRRNSPPSPPMYDPPPSYEDVVKPHTTPPPDYTTATSGMSRSGADNLGFVPDFQGETRTHLPLLRNLLRNLSPTQPPPRPPPPGSSRRTSKHSSLATTPNSSGTAECEVFVITPGSCKHNGACSCAYYRTPACSSTQDSRC